MMKLEKLIGGDSYLRIQPHGCNASQQHISKKEINRKAQLGRKHSQETIQKRTSQIKKKVKNLDTAMIFESISDCAKYYHKSACHMTRLIKQGFFNLKFI
jgi:hypothetical protein